MDGIYESEFIYTNEQIKAYEKRLKLLYSIPEGSIPLQRDFGLNYDCLDLPSNVAENLLALEITEKTEAYFEDLEVDGVEFTKDIEGRLKARIYLIYKGEGSED